jgi:hypothetical protein
VTTAAPPARLRSAMKPVGVNVKDVPVSVAEAVDADAQARDANRNDVVCSILADRFRVPFTPSGYPWVQPDGATQWNLRMSPELRDALAATAREQSGPGRRVTQRGLILAALQSHYGLPVQSPRQRKTNERLTPDQVREARARWDAGESLRSLAARYGVTRATITRAVRPT